MLISRGEELHLGVPLTCLHHAWGLKPMRRARHVSDTSRVKGFLSMFRSLVLHVLVWLFAQQYLPIIVSTSLILDKLKYEDQDVAGVSVI